MTTAIMNRTGITRPDTLAAAVALIALGIVANIATMPFAPEDDRSTIIIVSSVLSVLWLAGAWGAWQGIRWAANLALVVTVISGLLAVPGIPFADSTLWKILSAVGTLHAIAVVWLLLAKSTREALR